MLEGAIESLLSRVCRNGLPKPTVVMDSVEPGYFEGTLFLRKADGWGPTARAILSYVFGLAREGKLPAGAEQGAIDTLLPHLSLPCTGQKKTGSNGLPVCKANIGFPSECPMCMRPVKGGPE